MENEKLITAIIYCSTPQINGNKFLKYRNIMNNANKIAEFCTFAKKFPGAEYVNFYGKKSKQFIERIYLS